MEKKSDVTVAGAVNESAESVEPAAKADAEWEFQKFDPIQQTWRVNPADEKDYDGTIGYKDS